MDSFWPASSDFLLHLSLWWKSGSSWEVGWEKQFERGRKKVSDSRGPSRRFERTDDPWCQRSRSEGGSPDAPWDPGGGCKGERRVRQCELWWLEGWGEMSASRWRGGEGNKADIWQKMEVMGVKVGKRTIIVRLCGQVRRHEGVDGKWKPVTDDNTGRLQPWKNDSPGPEEFLFDMGPCDPAYLVEESLEDAGSFDWQRAGNSDLFFQYYCREWTKKTVTVR